MDRIGRDDHDWRDFPPRRLRLFQKHHRRKLDANASERREGLRARSRRDARSGRPDGSGDGLGELLQTAGNRDRPHQAPQLERVSHSSLLATASSAELLVYDERFRRFSDGRRYPTFASEENAPWLRSPPRRKSDRNPNSKSRSRPGIHVLPSRSRRPSLRRLRPRPRSTRREPQERASSAFACTWRARPPGSSRPWRVVDDDRDAALDVDGRAIAKIAPPSTLDFGELLIANLFEFGFVDRQVTDDVLVTDNNGSCPSTTAPMANSGRQGTSQRHPLDGRDCCCAKFVVRSLLVGLFVIRTVSRRGMALPRLTSPKPRLRASERKFPVLSRQRSRLHPQSFVQCVFRVAPRRNLAFELLHRPDEAELLLSRQPVHSRYKPRIHVASSAAQKSPYSLVWGGKTSAPANCCL